VRSIADEARRGRFAGAKALEQTDELRERERVLARHATVDNGTGDVRELEAEDELGIAEASRRKPARAVAGEVDSEARAVLERPRKRLEAVDLQRPDRRDVHGAGGRRALEECRRKGAAEAISPANEHDIERALHVPAPHAQERTGYDRAVAGATLEAAAVGRRRRGVAAIVALVAASAVLLQPFGYNQGSQLALVKALADGTARIDAYRDYSGDESYYRGHFYSDKAPGLALATLPAYEALRAAHLPRGVHVLSLWSVVLPAAILLLLVRDLGERVEPGYGTAAAATLAVATLLLPFTGMFFAHALSALLGFAAFALLWREREGPERLAVVALAGLLAGLAVTVEYPLFLVACALAVYALSRSGRVRRAAGYCLGFVVGVAPLAAYNRWAFGSVLHPAYADVTAAHGTSAARARRATPRPAISRSDLIGATVALAGWVVVFRLAPPLLERDGSLGALAAALLGGSVVAAVWRVVRAPGRAALRGVARPG
jgi:hypothetical protein